MLGLSCSSESQVASIALYIVDGPVRVFMIAQPVSAVVISVARPYISLTSTRAGSLARPPSARSLSKRSTSECRRRTTPVVAERCRADGVNSLLVITAAKSAE